MKELTIEKQLITDPEVLLKSSNYTYIKDRLLSIYNQKVSALTIINRAKKGGFYLARPKRKTS